MWKSHQEKPKAIDLSHHLSKQSAGRAASPLKELYRILGARTDLISLAGGTPAPKYFPIESITSDVLTSSSFSTHQPSSQPPSTTSIHLTKFPPSSDPNDPLALAKLLQYGEATGAAVLRKFLYQHSSEIYKPAYADFEVVISCGNTDACYKAINLLCDPGDHVLVEEWTFPTTVEVMRSVGCGIAPVAVDSEGMIPEKLEEVLANWEVPSHGRRPRVMYMITVGQNPTGSNLPMERRKKIYEICVKYDVIIIEDEPYYFLQMSRFNPACTSTSTTKNLTSPSFNPSLPTSAWIESLTPSFLRIDYQGRVIRCDSFSKVIAPGTRCGWVTANPLFCERLLRHNEISTQGPNGLSQGFITKLLVEEWGMDRWKNWLRGLAGEYELRRDWLCKALLEEFGKIPTKGNVKDEVVETEADVEIEGNWLQVKKKRIVKVKDLVEFDPPSAGMFLWMKVNIQLHPRYKEYDFGEGGRKGNNIIELIDELWVKIALVGGVLIGPGRFFAGNDDIRQRAQFFRIAFSMSEEEELKYCARQIKQCMVDFFNN